MKKLIFSILTIVIFLALSSCGGNQIQDDNISEVPTPDTKVSHKTSESTDSNVKDVISPPIVKKSNFDYAQSWKDVKKHKSENKPKSALKVIENIYKSAKADNNDAQLLKSIIHKMIYLQQVEEDTAVKIQQMVLKEIKTANFPTKDILYSMLAEQYWNYYQQNRYKFLKRTKTTNLKDDNMKTWTLDKIIKEVEKYYALSLKNNKELKKIKIELYDDIIYKRDETRKYRSNLYDFLAHRAIDFYSNSQSGLTRPAYYFTLNDKKYLTNTDKFSKLKIESQDTENFKYLAIKVYQELVKSHLNDENKEALIDLELKRLKFVYTNGVIADKKYIYEKILKDFTQKYNTEKNISEIYYELASLYYDLSNNYKPEVSDKYKDYKIKSYKLCQDTEEKYKNTLGEKNCKKLRAKIKVKYLNFIMEKANPKTKAFKGFLTYRNIEKVFVKVVKTDFKEYFKQKKQYKKMINFYLDKKTSQEFELDLPNDNDYNLYKTEIPFQGLKPGKYIVMLSSQKDFNPDNTQVSYSFINISNISYIVRTTYDNGLEIYVKDRTTGKALKNVKLHLYQQDWSNFRSKYILEKIKKLKTNSKGYVKITSSSLKSSNYFYINFIKNDDSLFLNKTYNIYNRYTEEKKRNRTFFFTDRKIYRPGQTLYFKALLISKHNFEGEKTKILKNKRKTIFLYDVNSQKVASLDLKTNEFGTLSGTFQIPKDGLTGQYYITDNYNDTHYFSVEEYKRPKFEVKFKKSKIEYKLNDKVSVIGFAKAFAGFMIDSAKVKYRVVRTTFYPYSWYWYGYTPPTPSVEIKNGFTTTNNKGEFTVKFDAIPDLSTDKSKKPAFRYTVYADVTDLNGETRFNSKIVSIGYTALKLNLGLSSQNIDKQKSKTELNIYSSNLSGEFLEAKGDIKIYRLKTPNKIYKNKIWGKSTKYLIKEEKYTKDYPNDVYKDENNMYKWKRGDIIFKTPFDTAKSKIISLKNIKNWESGKYVIEAYSKDKFNNEIKDIKYFTLFDSKSKKLPFKQLVWFTKLNNKTLDVGDNAEFLIGSSEKNVSILYEIEHRGKIVSSKEIKLNNEQKKISIPIKEKHRGNFFVKFAFIKHNRIFNFNNSVYVPWTNKKLKISFETFRNKLNPGEKDEWKLKISGANKDKVMAEMVATLYDASLDVFRANSWYVSMFPSLYSRYSWGGEFNLAYSSNIGYYHQAYGATRKHYDKLNWFGFYWRNYYSYRRTRGSKFKGMISKSARMAPQKSRAVMKKEVAPVTATLNGEESDDSFAEAEDKPMESKNISGDANKRAEGAKDGKSGGQEGKNEDFSTVQIRTNFNETAFFYPHLKTDKEGNIIISFTAPESLTKWKMLGFAHTKDLQFGTITNELVTQKDLMVIPNAPRFLREGDTIKFTAKVTNLTEKTLKGKSKLMLFDAVTMKPVDNLFNNNNNEKDFMAKKGESSLLTWSLKIPDTVTAVTYRIVAKSGNFSDGEEMAIPILSNRMLVTETMPLSVRALQTKTFKFKKLIESKNSKTLKNHKLTLEFTSNPVWYAVQALPYLIEYPYECMEQTFSRYYANSLASFIVNSSPKIKRVFDAWKNDKNSKELISNLEKNQELKSLILKETPWVRDAYSETEQKRRVALLFDLNKMSRELKSAIKKLKDGQKSSGAWPWFSGGYESRWITQHIVTGFAHLHRLKVIDVTKDTVIWNMMKNAIAYLDREIKKDYDRLITYERDLTLNNLGHTQIHYLYARSYFKEKLELPSSTKTAFNYYLGQSKKYWSKFNKYSQAMIALSLSRYGDEKTAIAILDSIKEHFIESEEMGIYFKESYGYYWYNAPIETHALLVEAFDEIKNDAKTIDGLKTWLLKSKQTQNWKTTKATVDAIFALLLRGDDWLNESKLADITVGGVKLEPAKDEAVKVEEGTGYFKVSWNKEEIKPEMGVVVVKNNNKLVAWGGVYWQYFEDLDKITFAETPLSIKKELFVERAGDKGPVLHPIVGVDPVPTLKIGERIKVRIILKVDRYMEFVHMKDMRASNLEPENVISRYKWQDGLGYYQSTKDASTDFFFDNLRKGTYVFEYPLRVTHQGNFSNGITTIQSMYAPEFSSHSKGVRIEVK